MPPNKKKQALRLDLPKLLNSLWPFLVLSILTLFVLIPIAPHIQLTPSTDSSVFLYTGDRILEGAVPYKDVWDHKGPLIYYIDALGLFLANGSRWGIWFLEFIAVLISVCIGFSLMKRAFGIWPAIFAAVLFVIELRLVLDLGNLTEEFALPFQFLLLWLFWQAAESKRYRYFFLIGVVSALCFLLRPNIIGIPVGIGLTVVWQTLNRDRQEGYRKIGAIVIGGLLILGLVSIYFLFAQAFSELWDSVFTFNFAYSAQAGGNWLETLFSGFANLPLLTMFGLTGWVLAFAILFFNGKRTGPREDLMRLVVITVPAEMLLTAMTGNTFPHYYMTWLPILAMSSGFFLVSITSNLWFSPKRVAGADRLPKLIAIALALFISIVPLVNLMPTAQSSLSAVWKTGGLPLVDLTGHRYESVLNYVFKNVPADQPLLIWGNQVTINWLTDRDSPTRFAYQTPLFVEGYVDPAKIGELITALEIHPGVIVDSAASSGFIPSIETDLDQLPSPLKPLYQYLQENYIYAGTFHPTGWDLYLYNGQGVSLEADQ